MDEVQVAINETRIDSEDLILLNYCIDLLLDPTLPTEQFDINNYIPALPKKDSSIKKIPEITAKKQFDQSCDILAAAISESQIDMDDFSAFEKISKRDETATDPNFQLTPGRDISENLTLSDTQNTSLNPGENQVDYPTNKESLKENEKPISTLGLIENATLEQKNTKFICTFCNRAFLAKGSLKRHIKSVHEGKRPQKCNKCELRFVKMTDLNRHLESVHEKKKPFQCEICDYSCSLKFNLKRHFQLVHEKTKLFKCDICDYTCYQKSDLKRHLESVHVKKKPFRCDICDYRCSQKVDLKKHLDSVHQKKKPFKCNICDHNFSQKSNMKIHLESVHVKKKPLKCSIFDTGNSSKQKLKKHISVIHEVM
jgi:hypothetical protein